MEFEERRLNIYPNEYSPILENAMSDLNDAQLENDPNLKEDRHEFTSGAKRSCTKPAYHLFSKIAMERLAKVLTYGGNKYGAYNWEKGLPVSDCLNHAIEHIYEFLAGDRCTEPEIDHLGHAFCNLMFAIDMMATQPERQTDLRPARLPPEDWLTLPADIAKLPPDYSVSKDAFSESWRFHHQESRSTGYVSAPYNTRQDAVDGAITYYYRNLGK